MTPDCEVVNVGEPQRLESDDVKIRIGSQGEFLLSNAEDSSSPHFNRAGTVSTNEMPGGSSP